MKVVVNTKEHYLCLSAENMQMIADLLGWKVMHPGKDSRETWFRANGRRVDEEAFRANPVLVRMVEEGKTHKWLQIVEIPDGMQYAIARAYPEDFCEEAFSYAGEWVVQANPACWYPKRLLDLYDGEYESLSELIEEEHNAN